MLMTFQLQTLVFTVCLQIRIFNCKKKFNQKIFAYTLLVLYIKICLGVHIEVCRNCDQVFLSRMFIKFHSSFVLSIVVL